MQYFLSKLPSFTAQFHAIQKDYQKNTSRPWHTVYKNIPYAHLHDLCRHNQELVRVSEGAT